MDNRLKNGLMFSVAEIMKREADAGAMTGSGGPTSPHKRYRQGDDELRLLIPSKVRFYHLFYESHLAKPVSQSWSRSIPGSFKKFKHPRIERNDYINPMLSRNYRMYSLIFEKMFPVTFKFVLDETHYCE